ncbi:hypothetical protein [Tenacibaculum sp. 190524A05c]|uniref:Nucleic acid binding protein n=1 Tax=Tenacibaculum platacis TaxID=3137852 RepID=A0ABM9P3G8_9FLAO
MNSLKKNKKLILVSIIVLAGFFTYNYVFQEAETTEDIEVVFTGSSKDLISKINEGTTYTSKAVLIEGKISTINDEGIVIDESVFCQFTNPETVQQLKQNQSVKVKGIIIGYDDLLNELKLNQCIIKD